MKCNALCSLVTTCVLSLCTASCGGTSGTGGTGDGGISCASLTGYTPTTTTTLSFASDIYPILSNTSNSGCAQTAICHGTTPVNLSATGKTTMSFTGGAATVQPELLQNSVNAPTVPRVTPGNVAKSFLAWKISGQDVLDTCMIGCVSGASTGMHMPCGDAMPSTGNAPGVLSSSDRTKILDWIAQGAAD